MQDMFTYLKVDRCIIDVEVEVVVGKVQVVVGKVGVGVGSRIWSSSSSSSSSVSVVALVGPKVTKDGRLKLVSLGRAFARHRKLEARRKTKSTAIRALDRRVS